MLKLYMRKNMFANRKQPYTYFSKTNGTVTVKDLIREIGRFNTTATEADACLIMNILEKLFNKFIAEGLAVQLPMGTFRACASGTAASDKEAFLLKSNNNDHDVTLHFTPSRQTAEKLRGSISYERISDDIVRRPEIRGLYNSANERTTEFHQGDYVLLKGRFLKCNTADPEQGVFIASGEPPSFQGIHRFTRFFISTRGKTGITIPPDFPCGKYALYVVSCPDMTVIKADYTPLTVLPAVPSADQ